MTHFSECIPVIKRRMTVCDCYKTCTLLILWNQNSLFHWHCLWSTETYNAQLLLNCGRDAGSDEPRLLTVSTHWLSDWFICWVEEKWNCCMVKFRACHHSKAICVSYHRGQDITRYSGNLGWFPTWCKKFLFIYIFTYIYSFLTHWHTTFYNTWAHL